MNGERPLPASRRALGAIAAAGLVIALVPRLAALRGTDFPLNDGGMFSVMVGELADNAFVPPTHTTYNNAGIPWAYPPLPFYAAAALVKASGVEITTLLHWLPLLINLASVLVFPWAVAGMVRGRASLLVATLTFAILPFSFNWQIMGGGLTRAPGMLFAVLALGTGHRVLRGGRRRDVAWTVLFVAAAILSHPEMPVLCGTMLAILWLAEGRSPSRLRVGLVIAAGVAALTAPWWMTVLVRYGPTPLLAAGGTVEWTLGELAPLPLLSFTGEGYATPLAVLAVFGFFFELSRRRPLAPLWLLAAFAVPRLGFRAATIPTALLVGAAFGDLILPALTARAGDNRTAGWKGLAAGAALTILLLGHALVFVTAPSLRLDPASRTLTAVERDAMSWVASNTPRDSRFVVVSSAGSWAEDPASEWFPVLARRSSVVTPQGCEWLGGEYRRRARAYDALKRCSSEGVPCLARWSEERGIAFTHLFVSKVPRGVFSPARLAAELISSSRFVTVYEGPGALVLAVRGG